jgi:medium-chain acyl-[acyl-carrier-protein] hydrolase
MSSNIKRPINPWVTELRPNPRARMRFFCFPYAGGNAVNIYRSWPDYLPKDLEVCAIQLPGRGTRIREPAHKHLEPLVHDIEPAIKPYLNKPFVFFGHSMGAMISFELARALRSTQAPGPSHLFVSGRIAPHIPDPDPPTYHLPEEQFIAEVKALNGTPKEVLEHPELMQLMIPLLRADFSVCQTYSYADEPPLDCPITALGGLQDHKVGPELLEPWKVHTTAEFKLRMLPGDHFFLHGNQAQLLHLISGELQQLSSSPTRV